MLPHHICNQLKLIIVWDQEDQHQPGVAGEVEVVVSDVGDVGNSLRGRLKVAPTLPVTEHLPLSFVNKYHSSVLEGVG